MIIGICGLIGSGKDTIADHLVDDHSFVKLSFEFVVVLLSIKIYASFEFFFISK